MYSIRPYASENADMDLPTTMYKIQPLVQSVKVIELLKDSP